MVKKCSECNHFVRIDNDTSQCKLPSSEREVECLLRNMLAITVQTNNALLNLFSVLKASSKKQEEHIKKVTKIIDKQIDELEEGEEWKGEGDDE